MLVEFLLFLTTFLVKSFYLVVLRIVSDVTPYVNRDLNFLRQKRAALVRRKSGDDLETTFEHLPCLLKDGTLNLPHIATDATHDLTIVIPCYNEEKRLPFSLKEIVDYCERRREIDGWSYEIKIIVVDEDGQDRTADVALEHAEECGANISVIKLDENIGKGGAVRTGVLCASGRLILFVDADGATEFAPAFEDMEAEIEKYGGTPAVVIGSRAHLKEQQDAQRSLHRSLLTLGFHTLVHHLAVKSIKDTQCGFKLFNRPAAAELFAKMHIEQWAFDVELLYLAQKCNIPIEEVNVQWTEKDGSKLTPIWSWFEMGRDLMLINYRYHVGEWRNELPA